MENQKDYIELLNEYYQATMKSLVHFQYSYEKVQKIGIKEAYSIEEFESFEAYTSRFSRLADIFTSRFLRTILLLLREDRMAFIDQANYLEKMEVILSADRIIAIKDLRNAIVHEYWEEQVKENFRNVFELSDDLINCAKGAFLFANNRGWLNE